MVEKSAYVQPFDHVDRLHLHEKEVGKVRQNFHFQFRFSADFKLNITFSFEHVSSFFISNTDQVHITFV